MSLPTLSELKAHLRIPAAQTAQDTLLTDKLAQAKARAQRFIGTPITAVEKTFRDVAETAQVYGVVTELMLPEGPIDTVEDVTVVDVDDETVPAADYEVDGDEAVIRAVEGVTFSNGPYEITATVGLSADDDYAADIEPVIRQVILDLAADLYQNRNPSASGESAGGGVSISRSLDGIPGRMLSTLEGLRWRGGT
jgi:uncharacterized phiE125 gp8 family phage protein